MAGTGKGNGFRQKILEHVLAREGPFTTGEVASAESINLGTVSAVVSMLVGARILKVVGRRNKALIYLRVRDTTVERALRSLHHQQNQAYRRATGGRTRTRRRITFVPSTEPPRVEGLAALRQIFDKAERYDKLLAYLGLQDEDVRTTLAEVAP